MLRPVNFAYSHTSRIEPRKALITWPIRPLPTTRPNSRTPTTPPMSPTTTSTLLNCLLPLRNQPAR
ncbi:MAG: hypothetical protein U0470_03120 [Anaerolineae bacterium]